MRRGVACLLLLLCISAWAEAQTPIFWKKDHIQGASGSTIAIATPAPSDETAPTTPSSLTAGTIDTTSIALSWTGSTDSGGSTLAGYTIYRGAVPVGAVTSTSFMDVGLVPNTTYTYKVAAFDHAYNYSAYSASINVPTTAASGAPVGLTAAAASTTQVNLTWSVPAAGAPHHYGIWRRSSGSWSKIDTAGSASYADTSVSATTAYLYKVSAEDGSNALAGWTNVDLATTVVFTDDTLTVGSTVVKAVHVTELRTAVNAVRAAAGLAAASWTNASLSSAWIKAVDVSELRSTLGDAVNALGLTAPNYTDTTLAGTKIKKDHIEQLRQRVK